jgi:prolyl oligopeptidase PreP (S9A serine peptidase family)
MLTHDLKETSDCAGKLVAVNLSEKGSDWKSTKVLQVPSEGPPTDLPDLLKYVKFSSPSWTADNRGFFYSRCAPPSQSSIRQLQTTWNEQKNVMLHQCQREQHINEASNESKFQTAESENTHVCAFLSSFQHQLLTVSGY